MMMTDHSDRLVPAGSGEIENIGAFNKIGSEDLVPLASGGGALGAEIPNTMAKISEDCARAQKSTIEGVKSAIESLTKIGETLVSDESKGNLAEKIVEVSKQFSEINKNNNGTWKAITLGVAAAAVAAYGGYQISKMR